MEKNETTYNGEFLIDMNNPHWTANSSFSLDINEKVLESEEAAQEDNDYNKLQMITPAGYMKDINATEWQVFRNGKWMDTVYFQPGMTSDDVRQSLVEHDSYPADICLLSVNND